jgi:hypothetical protein
MPWKRGDDTVEVELANVQTWIESTDIELHGNGSKGMIRQFWEDRSYIKGAVAVLMFFGGGTFLLDLLRVLGVIK